MLAIDAEVSLLHGLEELLCLNFCTDLFGRFVWIEENVDRLACGVGRRESLPSACSIAHGARECHCTWHCDCMVSFDLKNETARRLSITEEFHVIGR